MAENRYLKIILELQDKASKQLGGFSRKLESMESQFSSMQKAGAVAFGAVSLAIIKTSRDATRLDSISQSFEAMTDKIGVDSENLLEKLREASAGAVSNYDLMLSSNRAMALGVAKNTEEFAELLEIARLKGRQMGLDVTQAFNDIVTGIGRGSPLILDNLGIVIKATESQEAYAQSLGKTADELTENEKKEALKFAVLQEGRRELQESGKLSLTYAEQQAQVTASLKNLSAELGSAFLPAIGELAERLLPVIERFSEWSQEHPKAIKNIALLVGGLSSATMTFGTFGLLLPPLIKNTRLLITSIRGLSLSFNPLVLAIGVTIGAFVKIMQTIRQYKKDIQDLSEVQQRSADTNLELVKKTQDNIIEAEKSGNERVIELARAKAEKAKAIVQNQTGEELKAINDRVRLAQEALSQDSKGQSIWASLTTKNVETVQDSFSGIDMSSFASTISDSTDVTDDLVGSLKNLSETYSEVKNTASDALFELREGHKVTLAGFSDRIKDIRKSMSGLRSDFSEGLNTDKMGLAEKIVGAQDEIADIEARLGRTLSDERRIQLEEELAQKRGVLEANSFLIQSIEEQLNEVRRRNSLTDIEREIEDYNKKRELAQKEFNLKMSELSQEMKRVKEQRKQEIEIYKTKTEFIKEQEQALLELHKKNSESNLMNTKEAIEKEIDYYRMLAEAISAVRGGSGANAVDRAIARFRNVDDAIISPNGDIVSTHPDDWLIATKTPQDLMGGKGGIVINITGGVFGSDAGEEIGNMIIERLGLVAKL